MEEGARSSVHVLHTHGILSQALHYWIHAGGYWYIIPWGGGEGSNDGTRQMKTYVQAVKRMT